VSIEPKRIKTNWHMPSSEEIDWAKQVFLKVFSEFSGKLENVSQFTEVNEEFNKRMLKNLQILLAAHNGVSTILSFWDNDPIKT